MNNKIYLGLVHHPVTNKRGEVVTTSVTNLDIHDIARSCKTFNVSKYFIITPLEAQHELVQRILGHWEMDKSAMYNPDRQNALANVSLLENIDQTIKKIEEIENKKPILVVTGANFKAYDGGTNDLMAKMKLDNMPCLVLFGTGWGLHASVVERADFRLTPIRSNSSDGYNHLSVRSAVAIYLDRLAGSL